MQHRFTPMSLGMGPYGLKLWHESHCMGKYGINGTGQSKGKLRKGRPFLRQTRGQGRRGDPNPNAAKADPPWYKMAGKAREKFCPGPLGRGGENDFFNKGGPPSGDRRQVVHLGPRWHGMCSSLGQPRRATTIQRRQGGTTPRTLENWT